MNDKDQVEQQVTETLIEGEMEAADPEEAAAEKLRPRYEIRIQAKTDPIVEETRKFRSIAEEVDDRYDSYMRRAKQHGPDE